MIIMTNLDKIYLFNNLEEEEFILYDKTKSKPNNKIGYINYIFGFEGEYDKIELTSLEIYEEYKQKGFGRFLLNNFIEYFKNHNDYDTIYVYINSFGTISKKKLNNEDLIKWYESFGFKKYSENIYFLNV